jgi:tRNA(Ile)-lysidine synthase
MLNLYVGVSGGVDSMVLLSYIHQNKDLVEKKLEALGYTQEFELLALNFHHGDYHCTEALFLIKEVTSKLGIPLITGETNGIHSPTEDSWRKARYEFFDSVIDTGDILLLAHHWTDNKTSYLINTLKGSDRGFIPPISNRGSYLIFRPFHLIDKLDIMRYAESNNIPYIEDPTNEGSQRGRIESMLPELEDIISQMPGALRRRYRMYLEKNQFNPLSFNLY